MYLGGTWYALKILPQYRSTDPIKGLDVSILQDHLLALVLGIVIREPINGSTLSAESRGLKGAGTPRWRRYGSRIFHVSDVHRRTSFRGGRRTPDAAEVYLV